VLDIAYAASEDGGVLVHWGARNTLSTALSTDPASFFDLGGASAGAPQWAGVVALADQVVGRRLGAIDPALYRIWRDCVLYPLYPRAFHDPPPAREQPARHRRLRGRDQLGPGHRPGDAAGRRARAAGGPASRPDIGGPGRTYRRSCAGANPRLRRSLAP
jgi:hypothetical protein